MEGHATTHAGSMFDVLLTCNFVPELELRDPGVMQFLMTNDISTGDK